MESKPASSNDIAPCSWIWSRHPGKRAVEKAWLLYTPVWATVCGIIMVGGFAERWGDLALMLLGLSIATPTVLLAVRSAKQTEPELRLHDTAGFKLALAVVSFAFFLNYTQTPFFFDVLHAHFGFRSTINIRNNPLFLYFMTVAYFGTYAVLLMMAYRASQVLLSAAPRSVRLVAAGVACVAVACLEAVFNATPLTRHLYCFDEPGLAL
jgi:cycloeucalenol cycloisomerase